jgi:hypothetical protein
MDLVGRLFCNRKNFLPRKTVAAHLKELAFVKVTVVF